MPTTPMKVFARDNPAHFSRQTNQLGFIMALSIFAFEHTNTAFNRDTWLDTLQQQQIERQSSLYHDHQQPPAFRQIRLSARARAHLASSQLESKRFSASPSRRCFCHPLRRPAASRRRIAKFPAHKQQRIKCGVCVCFCAEKSFSVNCISIQFVFPSCLQPPPRRNVYSYKSNVM